MEIPADQMHHVFDSKDLDAIERRNPNILMDISEFGELLIALREKIDSEEQPSVSRQVSGVCT